MAHRPGADRTSGVSRRQVLGMAAAVGGWLVAGDLLAACDTPAAAGGPDDVRIGFVSASQNGPRNRLEMERNCLRLAVEELNAAGGLAGHQVTMVEAAGRSTAERVAQLFGKQRAALVVGTLADEDRPAVAAELDRSWGLLIDAAPQTAAPCSSTLLTTGLLPSQQLTPMVDWVVANVGRHVVLLSSNGAWSRSAAAAVRAGLRHHDADAIGVHVVGDEDSLVAALPDISRANADVLWSLLEGSLATRFATKLANQGMSAMIVASQWDEVDAAANPGLLSGAMTSQAWLMSLDTPESHDYVNRYQHRFGTGRPVCATGEAISLAVGLYAAAVKRAGSTAVERVLRALPNVELRAARGAVRMDRASHVAEAEVYVGQIGSDGTIDFHDQLPRPATPPTSCPSN